MLGALPVGSYDINVRIIDRLSEFREVVRGGGQVAWEPSVSFEKTISVDLAVGETATVSL